MSDGLIKRLWKTFLMSSTAKYYYTLRIHTSRIQRANLMQCKRNENNNRRKDKTHCFLINAPSRQVPRTEVVGLPPLPVCAGCTLRSILVTAIPLRPMALSGWGKAVRIGVTGREKRKF